jgi:K+ transporter
MLPSVVMYNSTAFSACCMLQVINWTLMTLTIIVVATFQTSAKLGRAYGEPPVRNPHQQP